jgi:hypothetical protein
MAARNIAQTDTLETFRTQFNALAADDFGDIGTLDPSLTATTVIGAVNEINGVVTAAAGWFITDDATNIQAVGSGQTLSAFGTVNQVTAVVSSPDKLTLGLTDDVTIANDLTVTGDITSVGGDITNVGGSITAVGNISGANITGTGTTHTLGTVQISGNTITSTDSAQINIDEVLDATEFVIGGLRIYTDGSGYGIIKATHATPWITLEGDVSVSSEKIAMQGATANAFYTTLKVVDPTASRDIVFPDAAGNVILDATTAYATSSIFATSSTLNIYNSAGVLQKTIVGSST